MSDYIPFDVHSEIIKWLPEKSLLRFRTVSKAWKAHIDTNHKRRLRWVLYGKLKTLGSDAGFVGFIGDVTKMGVIWNPTIGKSVGIYINPNVGYAHTIVGFGVCHFDPKLVNISVKQNMWDVDVFSLSTRRWRNVHRNMQPFELCKLECAEVCINGVIYFHAYVDNTRSYFFISFNLESGAFGKVPFPRNLERTRKYIQAAKVDESLGILEYHDGVCDVWTKEEGANEFTMKDTIRVEGQWLYGSVLEFRNNGNVLLGSRIEVYDPLPGRITIGDIGIN